MKRISFLLVLIAAALGACERHEFDGEDGTRQLHEEHPSKAAKGNKDDNHSH